MKNINKFFNKKLLILSLILTFIFLSADILSTSITNLCCRQPNSIVVQAKGFSSGGGFKSGSFSSRSSKFGGFKSGSFSSGGSVFSGSGSSTSRRYSSSGGHTYIPIPIFWGSHRSYYGASAVGGIASGFAKFILFIIVATVIYNIIKSRRY